MIHINPLGEITDLETGELLHSSLNITAFEKELGRPATPSDFDRRFRKMARKAIKDERDWLLYLRSGHLSSMFGPDDTSIRVVARRDDRGPKVWLSRYIYTRPGEPEPHPPAPWFISSSWDNSDGFPEEEQWVEHDATLDVTTMHDGEIFKYAYELEYWLAVREQEQAHA